MKIYKGDMTIECSAEEFVKIKDDLLDAEAEEKTFNGKIPGFEYLEEQIGELYASLFRSPNYD